MNINIKLDEDFTQAFGQKMYEYGQRFAQINGFAEDQINYTGFIDNFIDSNTVADASIDGNANVGHKDILTLLGEMSKPHQKILSFNKIFYELKKKYGLSVANEWLDKEWTKALYMHDSHNASFIPYCYAYDLKDLAEKGLYFLEGFNSEPPKHLGTFVDFVKEFISFAACRSSGAVGMPNLVPYMYYFWSRDVANEYYTKTPEKYAEQHIQRLIYALNQPYVRDGAQSAFTNTSIFDHPYLEALFGGAVFPDGAFMIDEIEGIMEFQKMFLKVMSEIRSRNMFTFPVNSISLLRQEGKFIDEEFAKYAIEHNMKWSDSNLFIDSSVTSLSNCPLSGDTNIVYYSPRFKQWYFSPIKELYYNMEENGTIKTIANGKVIECKINRFNIPCNYEITLANNEKIITTANHLNKVLNKDYVRSDCLTTDDYLPYYLHPLELTKNLTYEDGKLVGMFLGDGSYYNNNAITYSLNGGSKAHLVDWLEEYTPKRYNAKINEWAQPSQLTGEYNCINVSIVSKSLRGLIEQFVIGNNALEKSLSADILNTSIEFRKGIVDGLYQTDGGNSNRIYTSSSKMVKALKLLFASLGMVTIVNEDNRDGRLGKNTCYTVRYYTPSTRTKFKDVYIIDGDYIWFRIKEIKQLNNKSSFGYCLEVLDEDVPEEFMLANGIVTHNCRLKSSIKDLGYFNSIGSTALRVGSVKVSTINLARLALEHEDEDSYIEALKEITELNLKALDVVRSIIVRNIEKGLLPNYTKGLIDINTQYNTTGVIGIYETMKSFGYTKEDEFGYVYYTDEADKFGKRIFDAIKEVETRFGADKNYMINTEAVPAETAAAKMQKADAILFPNDVVDDLPLYGNQFMPLGVKATMQERVRIASLFDSYCNGGSILHVNIEAPFNGFDQAWAMTNYIADQGVTYFAFNTKIQACKHNHAFFGKICPECGEPVETEYSRIVGFYVPVKTYSKERKNEYKMRQWENVNAN